MTADTRDPPTPVSRTVRPLAIVTGGLRGIGRAVAAELAGDGFDLAIIDLAEPCADSEAALRELRQVGAAAGYYRLDIAEIECHEAVLAEITAAQGAACCLVNNAGIAARPLTDILDLGVAAFDRSIDINLRGSFFLTQAFARRLLAVAEAGPAPAPTAPRSATHSATRSAKGAPTTLTARQGGTAPLALSSSYRSIVNITSIAAELVSPDRAQYCITKAALSMTTRLFAARLAAHDIHVHEVRPGFIRTDMTASAGSETIDRWIEDGRVPIPRWGEPADVGRAVSALACGRLPYLTGQPFWVAGGLNLMRAT